VTENGGVTTPVCSYCKKPVAKDFRTHVDGTLLSSCEPGFDKWAEARAYFRTQGWVSQVELQEQVAAAQQRGYEKAVQEDIEREKVALRHYVEAPEEGFNW
jgi:hypothetical protein